MERVDALQRAQETPAQAGLFVLLEAIRIVRGLIDHRHQFAVDHVDFVRSRGVIAEFGHWSLQLVLLALSRQTAQKPFTARVSIGLKVASGLLARH